MKAYSIYFIFINKAKSITNFIVYNLIKCLLQLIKNKEAQVFPDSNGWFLTIKNRGYIYKFRWFFTLVRPRFVYRKLKSNIEYLIEHNIDQKFTPEIEINNFFIRQKYISNSIQLDNYILNLTSSQKKINIFLDVIKLIDEFHALTLRHGDLKAKNILVCNDRLNPFFVDLEYLTKADDYVYDDEYTKFLSSILCYYSIDEINLIASSFDSSHDVYKYISDAMLMDSVVIDILHKFDFISFEKEKYSNEDIDITVNNYREFKKILKELKASKYKIEVFYAFCDDIKIYIMNEITTVVIDIHLIKVIDFKFLIINKLIYNRYKVLYLTGPDGVGKSTIINGLLEGNYLLKISNARTYHANRFVNEIFKFKSNRLWDYCCQRSPVSFLIKKILLIILKIKGKSKVIIFDRSFHDSNIQYGKGNMVFNTLERIFLRNDHILLLVDRPEHINLRKNELTNLQIENYYNSFNSFNVKKIKVEGLVETQVKVTTHINAFLLNN